MNHSILEMFTIGVGPSASHTVAPMRAARAYVERLQGKDMLVDLARLQITLYGSLAFTGKGHGTDKALILGLHGSQPASVEPDYLRSYADAVIANGKLTLMGGKCIAFSYKSDLIFNRKKNVHNRMEFRAYDSKGENIDSHMYQSVGGGFLANDQPNPNHAPYSFSNAGELLDLCSQRKCSIADLTLANELTWHTQEELNSRLDEILAVMRMAITNGVSRTAGSRLPGQLRAKRRAPAMYEKLKMQRGTSIELNSLDWVNMYAIAVNEENASGERVVAAPTNGASGIIPAVIKYLEKFCDVHTKDVSRKFLLTAGCIGIIYKTNASLSGARSRLSGRGGCCLLDGCCRIDRGAGG